MTYQVMHGVDRVTDPLKTIFREIAVDASGAIMTAATAPANPALAPATSANQALQIAIEQAAADSLSALVNRRWNKADQKELQPGNTFNLPAGSYHILRWSVQPTDRNNANLNQFAKITINGNTTNWYANENGEHTPTELNDIDFTCDAVDARVKIFWEF